MAVRLRGGAAIALCGHHRPYLEGELHVLYKVCPNQDCNKKLIDEQNRLCRCEKCNSQISILEERQLLVNIVDFQEIQWVTCFKPAAETILGHNTAYLREL